MKELDNLIIRIVSKNQYTPVYSIQDLYYRYILYTGHFESWMYGNDSNDSKEKVVHDWNFDDNVNDKCLLIKRESRRTHTLSKQSYLKIDSL